VAAKATDDLEKQEEIASVLKALDGLPTDQKEVIVLGVFQDLSLRRDGGDHRHEGGHPAVADVPRAQAAGARRRRGARRGGAGQAMTTTPVDPDPFLDLLTDALARRPGQRPSGARPSRA
jgi:hypothetical protein